MRLADDTIITVGHETICLRASLRASFRLERRFRGFDKIVSAIADGNVSVMAAVIAESSTERTDLADLLDSGGALSIKLCLEYLAGPLIAHVGALAGFDADTPDDQNDATGERIPFAEHHTRLFRIATGWLGWAPDEAWNATPSEIAEAYKGLLEKLRAVHGSGENTTDEEPNEDTRRQLNAIGDLDNHHVAA